MTAETITATRDDHSVWTPRVLIAFGVATLIWGSTWYVIRDQLGMVPATWSVAYRFFVAATAMFAWARLTRVSLNIGREGQVFAVLLGFAQFVLNFNFVYRAEEHITSGLVAVVFALLIVPNALLAWLFLKQRVSVRFVIGSAVALVGVAMLIAREASVDASSGNDTVLGVGLTILGVLAASVANVMQGTERARTLAMAPMLGWAMLWGALINAAVAWPTVGPPILDPRPSYIIGVVYLGVFASAVAFTCYYIVIRAVGASRAAYSSVLTPILAMLLSTLFENYRWSWLAAAGGVVAMAGLLIALSARRPEAKSG